MRKNERPSDIRRKTMKIEENIEITAPVVVG